MKRTLDHSDRTEKKKIERVIFEFFQKKIKHSKNPMDTTRRPPNQTNNVFEKTSKDRTTLLENGTKIIIVSNDADISAILKSLGNRIDMIR